MCKVMGIVNVTPDSFSDGGQFIKHEEAIRRAKNLIADGANIVNCVNAEPVTEMLKLLDGNDVELVMPCRPLPHCLAKRGTRAGRREPQADRQEADRQNLGGNVAIAVWAAMNGASVVRVHDVKETVQALRVVEKLKVEG